MKIDEGLSLSSAKITLCSFKKWNVSVECFLSVKRIRSHRQYHWCKSKFCHQPLSVPPYPTSHTISHPSLRLGSCGSLRSFCWVLLSVAASLRSHASQVTELRFLCAADVWFPDTDVNILLTLSSQRLLLLIRIVMQINMKLQCDHRDHRTTTKNN